MTKSIDLVREFHEKFDIPIKDEPEIDSDRGELRCRLLQEEVDELCEAIDSDNLVEVLDALTDLQYVLDGTYLEFGMAHLKGAALAEVHRSNLTKLGEDGRPIRREDGKVLKGPNYEPPDLEKIMGLDKT